MVFPRPASQTDFGSTPFLCPGHHPIASPSDCLPMAIVLLLDFLPLSSMTLKYSCPSPPDVMLKMDQNEIILWDKYPFFLKDKETSTDLDQLVYLQQALF